MTEEVKVIITGDARKLVKATKSAASSLKKLDGAGKGAGKSAEKTSKQYKKLTSSLKATEKASKIFKLAGKAAIVGIGLAALKAVGDLLVMGAQFQRLETAGIELARSLGGNFGDIVSALRKASLNTVADMDIIRSANRALMLGLGADTKKLANLMQIAAFRGRAMGLSTTQAFNDIVTGVGRASPMILDNLGIIIDAKTTYGEYAENIGKSAAQLTAMEKKQALLNSVLDEGNRQLEEAGGLAEDNATRLEQLSVIIANTKAEYSLLVTDALAPSIAAFVDSREKADFFREAMDLGIITMMEYRSVIDDYGFAQERVNEIVERATTELEKHGRMMFFAENAADTLKKEMALSTDVTDDYTEATRNAVISIGDLTTAALGARAINMLNQAYTDGVLTLPEYLDLTGDIMSRMLGMEFPAIRLSQALFNLEKQMEEGSIDAKEYARLVGELAEEVYNAEGDYRINIDVSVTGDTIPSRYTPPGVGGGKPPERAHGGPVASGKPYIVGEVGPELFIPDTAGRIDPGFAGGGSFQFVYAPMISTADEDEALNKLAPIIKQAIREQ